MRAREIFSLTFVAIVALIATNARAEETLESLGRFADTLGALKDDTELVKAIVSAAYPSDNALPTLRPYSRGSAVLSEPLRSRFVSLVTAHGFTPTTWANAGDTVTCAFALASSPTVLADDLAIAIQQETSDEDAQKHGEPANPKIAAMLAQIQEDAAFCGSVTPNEITEVLSLKSRLQN